jgi:hypothetical protein
MSCSPVHDDYLAKIQALKTEDLIELNLRIIGADTEWPASGYSSDSNIKADQERIQGLKQTCIDTVAGLGRVLVTKFRIVQCGPSSLSPKGSYAWCVDVYAHVDSGANVRPDEYGDFVNLT